MRPVALIALLAVCAVAARASAAPPPAVFRLSVSGTSRAEWDHTGAPTLVGGCQITVRSEGVRVARFRSARPTVIRFAGGKVQTAAVRVLAGTVTLSGHNTITENCGGPEVRTTEQSCAKTTRRFKNGRTTLTSSSAGRVTVRTPRVTLRRADCPREPADVVASPLGPAPTPLRISTSTLANARIARITLTASRTRRKDYGDPEAGSLAQRSTWTSTLVRVTR